MNFCIVCFHFKITERERERERKRKKSHEMNKFLIEFNKKKRLE